MRARQPLFVRLSALAGNFCRPLLLLPPWKFFWKTCGMETSIAISEVSTENGVAVVNAYRSILADNEDHVDNI